MRPLVALSHFDRSRLPPLGLFLIELEIIIYIYLVDLVVIE